jgi:predicted 3-demethylubiquinone-9 3-methyltransferase (glyoxalase superfamily)
MSEQKLPELKNKSLETKFGINQQILPSKMEEIMWRSSRRHKCPAWRN